MEKIQISCRVCGWHGVTTATHNIQCPECGGQTVRENNDETLSLKDIDDIGKLDKWEDDPTFLLNIHASSLHFYKDAAKETDASIVQEPATINNGEIYDKHPIWALY